MIFPIAQEQPSCSSEITHESVVAKADRQLRSNAASVATGSKSVRRRRKYASKSREYQRTLVVIDFPGKTPPPVQVLHDYDKVCEGALVLYD